MIEVLWHGRGGQGAFTAARLLGAAASLKPGCYSLAFPSFGPERRGAPMRAFTKLDQRLIGDRSASTKADFVIYLDSTLLKTGWDEELKPGGRVLVNSDQPFDDERIVALDADGISAALLGRAIPNTVFLGALAALCSQVDIQDVCEAIRQYMPAKLHEKNEAIVTESYRRVLEGINGDAAATSAGQADNSEVKNEGDNPATHVEPAASSGLEKADDSSEAVKEAPIPSRPQAAICTLRPSLPVNPEQFARNTCFEAGYLTQKNAGWRNRRPVVINDACTGCLQCYLLCPDGTIFKTGCNPKTDNLAAVAVDYDFCKGCGVCAKECPFDAIEMISESEVACS